MKQTGTEYSHIQKGIIRPIFLALAAVFLGSAFFTRGTPHMTVFTAAAIGCMVLSFIFGHLAVRDEGDHLLVRFGPIPLFKKSIPYAKITAVGKGRTHLLSGWGIHLTRKGWLWNIGGFECVWIEMGKKRVLVGTDDAEGLASFLQSKLAKS